VDKIVYPQHERACKRVKADPKTAKGILNPGCYPVLISQSFREWFKKKYPQLRSVFVPPRCTSKAQLADVVLNKPFKNYISREYIMHLGKEVDAQLEVGTELKDIKFKELATAAAGPALRWIVKGYEMLGSLDHKKGLSTIAYTQCWGDDAFVEEAMGRSGELLAEVLLEVELEPEPEGDDDDILLDGPLLPEEELS
jgi:hypothetical protein